jgi:hypothetical protein
MTTMTKNCLALLAFGLLATALLAHGDYVHLKGTVTKIDGNTITIETSEGETKEFTVTSDTKFSRTVPAASTVPAAQSATLKDLKVGYRVVVHVKQQGESLVAHILTFAAAPIDAAKHKAAH